jgi:hypothetical protein
VALQVQSMEVASKEGPDLSALFVFFCSSFVVSFSFLVMELGGAFQDKDMSSCSFTPFGGGQRLCPGLDLARLEASIFLHHFVTQFRYSMNPYITSSSFSLIFPKFRAQNCILFPYENIFHNIFPYLFLYH